MKIRITGRNLSKAATGIQTTVQTTCPPGYIYDDRFGCVRNQQSEMRSDATPGQYSHFEQHIGPRMGMMLKNKVGSWFGDTQSTQSQVASLLDPSGVSNYPFLNKAFNDFYDNPGILNGLGLAFETLGSIPIYGRAEKAAEAVGKAAWKSMTGLQKTARVIKAPGRAALKTAHALGVVASAPAKVVNRIYSTLGMTTPFLRNPIGTLNRGNRAWGMLYDLFGAEENVVNPAIEKGYSIYDQYKHPEDYQDVPQKAIGGPSDECPQGYSKDPVTLKCVPSMSAPENASGIDPWGAWSDNTNMQQPAAPLPQQTKVDTFGNVTTTGSVDIGNPRMYAADPSQNPQTNLYGMKGKCQRGYHKDKNGNCVPDKGMRRDLSPYLDIVMNTASGVSDFFNAKKNQKDWNKQFRQNILPDNRYVAAQADKGWVRTNEGDWPAAGYKTQNFGEYGGSMLKDSDMGKIKIRITGAPKQMAYGGQLGYGFDLGQRNTYAAMPKGKIQTVSKKMPEVPREEANIEAEKGETVYADVDGDGVQEHMNIGGERHVNGGTPLNVPEGSFVFSDTKKMKIKDPEILSKFGLSPKKEGYTPADIAKKYDINKYKAIIEDHNSDSLMKNTAMLMVKNYQKKLAELALIQEEMKGFPQGIPEMCRGVLPDELLNQIDEQIAQKNGQQAPQQQGGQEPNGVQEYPEGQEPEASNMETPEEEVAPDEEAEMMYGGNYEYGGDLSYFEDDEVPESEYGGPTKMQDAGQVPPKGQVTWLSPELQKAITDINQQTGKKVIVSPRVTAGDIYIPPTQHKQSTGLFGDVTLAELEEFKKRHEWYFKNNPDWDYKNPDDVLDFQQKYDDEFAKNNGFQYFVGDKKYNKKDGLYGEYTYNAPGLEENAQPVADDSVYGYMCSGRDAADKPIIGPHVSYPNKAARDAAGAYASPEEAAKNQCPPKDKTEPGVLTPKGKTSEPPFAYMTPDLVGMGVAAGMRGHKFLPYIAETAYEPNRYLPEDWKAKASQLKSLSEQMGKQIGDYMPGQNLQASLSNMYGQNAEALVGAVADVDARNVRGVNAFNQAEQERKDKFNLLRSANATERWKGNVIANQQWDNFLNKKNELMYDRYNNAWKNRMELGLVNSTNKFYYTDPFTGKTIFKGGYGPQDLGVADGTGNWDSVGSDYNKAAAALPGLTPSDYLDYLKNRNKPRASSSTGKYGGTMPRNKQKNSKLLADVLFSGHTLPF